MTTCLCWLTVFASAQVCTHPGQTPVTAILVCGTETLNMNTPTYCGVTPVPVPCNDAFPYRNTNPNFFRMACYQSGTLGFTITPDDASADYNWQLFDVTATNPFDIFTNPALFVACNWSSNLGETGASSIGNSLAVCSGAQPLFSQMPDIRQGHTYMLMVSNQTGAVSGYQLSFSGGSAVISNPIPPKMLLATPGCNGSSVLVRLNKKMDCSTIAADGSDFIMSNGIGILSATPADCSELGSDSVYLTLDQQMANGPYTLTIKTGSDGNTITDICGNNIPDGETLNFTVRSLQPTQLDSVFVTGCSPAWAELVFKKPIRCNSIAPDASDFLVTGPQLVSTSIAAKTITACANTGLTSVIRIDFLNTLSVGGTYSIQLVPGSDGNTITDECGLVTPGGASVQFTIKDPVSARFTYTIPPSCVSSPVSFIHDGNGGTTSWIWTFDPNKNSALQNPVHTFTSSGNHDVQLIVTNGKCTDTAKQTITIPGFLEAKFDLPAMICPGDTLHLENKTTGNADQWQWDFGNGNNSRDKSPSGFRFNSIGRDNYYTIRLIAKNTVLNCADTAAKAIQVLSNCMIAVPTAFTPNGDGRNDFLYPLNALKADNLEFKVYNRLGQLVFYTKDWTRKWDGRINGVLQQTGVYAWILSYTNRDSKQKVFLRGTVLLMR